MHASRLRLEYVGSHVPSFFQKFLSLYAMGDIDFKKTDTFIIFLVQNDEKSV
jgi:hypothetical protein